MVGFISNLAPLLNYLRRRSPAPPFPPDSRQAGRRGAINHTGYDTEYLFTYTYTRDASLVSTHPNALLFSLFTKQEASPAAGVCQK